MPYHSPNGGDRRGGWDHRGGGRDWDHDRNRFVYYGLFGWGSPVWPWWGWGSPFLSNDWGAPDDYDSQPASNYAASQPYPEYSSGSYEAAPPDESESGQPAYTPWPYSAPAPSASAAEPAPAVEAPVTLVFKDGRPHEQIRNYLLTPKTLSVLDQRRRDIPVDQIDLPATAKLNREAGVDFALPGAGR